MKDRINIMLDIETLGGDDRAPILAIGACAFDENGVDEDNTFYRTCSVDGNDMFGQNAIDPDTVEWWLQQSDEAQAALFDTPRRLTLKLMLDDFFDWVVVRLPIEGAKLVCWAKPPSFDCRIVKAACERCGVDWPFSWRDERDVRVIIDIAKELNIKSALHEQKPEIKHRADHDAVAQAKVVVATMRHLKSLS
jgi:DNA polymerase III epsilon subunit-like protein